MLRTSIERLSAGWIAISKSASSCSPGSMIPFFSDRSAQLGDQVRRDREDLDAFTRGRDDEVDVRHQLDVLLLEPVVLREGRDCSETRDSHGEAGSVGEARR